MKNLLFLLLLVSTLYFVSCKTETPVKEEPIVKLKGHEELDLTPWGFPMLLLVPDAENNGEAKVEATNRGALEITVGQNFGIEIIYGEGNIELFKTELDEDLVFTAEILREDSTLLVYKQDIPDSGVKTHHHFFFKTTIDNDVYEVRDLQSEQFGESAIEDMIKAVKTLRIAKKMAAPNV